MTRRQEVRDSHCDEPAGAARIGDVHPDRPVTVSVHLRHPESADHPPGSAADLAPFARPTTRPQLAARRRRRYRAIAVDIAAFAARAGLEVVSVNLPRRRIELAAPARRLSRAFDARLGLYERDGEQFRARTGPLRLPAAIAPWVRAVLGLDARTRMRRPSARVGDHTDGSGGLRPNEMAALYGIASDMGASGQCIGIIELGGGYSPDDLKEAADRMGVPLPVVVDVGVGAANDFQQGSPADREVALDLQVIAGAAPGVSIAVYFAPPEKFVDAVVEAVHDNRRKPSVLAISWGIGENAWTADQVVTMNAALHDAGKLGITVTAAAGDKLATDGQFGAHAHVDFPASSPYVIGCGGTRITLAQDRASIVDEIVWNEGGSGTGGGISDLFDVPDFQQGVALPPSANGNGRIGRGVPDVAAAAALGNGYLTVVGGNEIVQPGTSAVAPLVAALITLANKRRGVRLGFVNSTLYGDRDLFRPILQGDNISRGVGYKAGPVWNACCGLGAPLGAKILSKLGPVALA